MGLAIPLGIFVGLVEEFTFRGLLPLILAGKAGLSPPLVVVTSALIFGVSEVVPLKREDRDVFV